MNIVVVVKSVKKTVVIMVIRIEQYFSAGNEARDDYKYLMCRTDLNFEVDFGVNGAIGTIVTKWDLIVFR